MEEKGLIAAGVTGEERREGEPKKRGDMRGDILGERCVVESVGDVGVMCFEVPH